MSTYVRTRYVQKLAVDVLVIHQCEAVTVEVEEMSVHHSTNDFPPSPKRVCLDPEDDEGRVYSSCYSCNNSWSLILCCSTGRAREVQHSCPSSG